MNHSVKSKTIRHDCHLLVRAEQNHLKTPVFLLQLFKSNRHKLDSVKGGELFFLLGFARIIVRNRLLFSIKSKNVWNLLAGDPVLLLKFRHYRPLVLQTCAILHLKTNQHFSGSGADPSTNSQVTHAVTAHQVPRTCHPGVLQGRWL